MLDALYRYAMDQELAAEPGFAPKWVRWCLDFAEDGRYLMLRDLASETEKRGCQFLGCPEFPPAYMQAGGRAHFLVETANVVALHLKDADDPKARESAVRKREFFLALLEEAAAEVPLLGQVAAALRDPEIQAQAAVDLAERKAKPIDFVMVRWGEVFLPECDGWQGWWRCKRQATTGGDEAAGAEGDRVCFVTGEAITPLLTHPKIKRLGTPEPVLVGFDKDAFCSYGLRNSENAAVSERAAEAYRQGLNHLLEHHRVNLAGTSVVHWYSGPVAPEDDFFAQIEASTRATFGEAQRHAQEFLAAPRTAKYGDLKNYKYYALTLNSAGGRVMVRDWMHGQFPELAEAVAAWFRDLALVGFGGGETRPPRLEVVVQCVLPELKQGQNREKWQERVTAVRDQLWRCALDPRKPIPRSALALAVEQHRTAVMQLELAEGRTAAANDAELGARHVRFHTRLALMKAYHARPQPERRTDPVSERLNEQHPHPAYHCGRLLAVYADLQRTALGDVNAGVVQRFYGAASATPALVLGRLSRTANYHLRQLDPGLAYVLEGKVASIWAAIRNQAPATLSLEEQSLFALGYYQQIAHDRAEQAARAAEKRARKAANVGNSADASTANSSVDSDADPEGDPDV